MSKPLISVIIPSYNGAHKILQPLHSLEQQSISNFEVIVVIDGSSDDTTSRIRSAGLTLPALKIIEQKNKGRAGARNTGAANSQAELLMFLDDDMELVPDGLQKHLALQKEVEGTVGAGRLVFKPQHSGRSFFDRYRKWLSDSWEKPLMSSVSECTFLTAAHFSISASLFQKLGEFDEQLSDAEDQDLAWRIRMAGVRIFYLTSAVAYHNDPLSFRSYIKRIRQYRQAHIQLQQKWKDCPEALQFKVAYQRSPSFWKMAVYKAFASPVWLEAAGDHGIWKVMPRIIRYRLLNIITAALGVYYKEVPL